MPKIVQFEVLGRTDKDNMTVFHLLVLRDDGKMFVGISNAAHVPADKGYFNEVNLGPNMAPSPSPPRKRAAAEPFTGDISTPWDPNAPKPEYPVKEVEEE